jgi:uncharacterized protein YlzI (FlbEa/FlbD family)
MPNTKTVETVGKLPDTCILKMGKHNNVIQSREEIYNLATEEFGKVGVGTYFYTNVAYRYPFPHERDYNSFYVEPVREANVAEAKKTKRTTM